MEVRTKFKGLGTLKNLPDVIGQTAKDFESRAIKILSYAVERESKLAITELKAIRTGRLRASIRTSFRGQQGIIRPNTNYAYYVHEGKGSNRFKGRRPFMEIGANRAIDKHEEELGKSFEKHLVIELKQLKES